ncbi:MAG: beta-agarase, partial [Gemmatimonadales bacterium]|nr:beta-agarase [Gemmatimonadales bacterium]
DSWGGYADGPEFDATGFFYPKKHEGKWWLIDPDGRLFFSHGIDCVNWWAATAVADREHWFAGRPFNHPKWGPYSGTRSNFVHGYYEGRSEVRTFDFLQANLDRKYGADWADVYPDIAHARLESWGMNTVANWSAYEVMLKRRAPYTVAIHASVPELDGSSGYWGKFPDAFDPAFGEAIRDRMGGEIGRTTDDPYNIGYFVDNEISWG